MSAAPHEWVILQLRYGPHDLCLWVNYEDSHGEKRVAPVIPFEFSPEWPLQIVPAPSPQTIDLIALKVRVPADFNPLILDLLRDLPLQQTGPHGNGPVPLAIFIDAPLRTEITSWESVVDYLLPPEIDGNRIQFVRMPAGLLKGRLKQTAFSLPLRILAVGDACANALTQLWSSYYWYVNISEVQQYGINLETSTIGDTYRQLKADHWDIVLTDADSVAQVVFHTERFSGAKYSRPRLTIFVGPPESEPYVRSLNVPAGTAFLWVPQSQDPIIAPSTQELLKVFLYGIVHDYPLHEAVKSATRAGYVTLPHAPVLIADPISNNSLRLSDAIPQLVTKAEAIRPWSRLGDIEKFIARAGVDLSEPLREKLFSLDNSRSKLLNAVDLVKETPLRVVFDQESEGLVPLATAASAIETAHAEDVNIGATAASIINVPEFVEEIEKHQERHVDIALQHADSDPAFQPVDPSTALRQNGRYRVRVHIGHRAPDSVMIGKVPPVDPLLPEPEQDGYQLEVALFEKDFELLSANVQTLYLPRLGGSEPVFFEIRAPKRTGTSEARIGVYHQNNLLQSFLLKANVSPDPAEKGEPLKLKLFVVKGEDAEERVGGKWVEIVSDRQVLTALAFTQSARFSNLDQLGRRELSIGFNQDSVPSSHTFMLKTDGEARPLNVKDEILKQQTDAFRQILKTHVHDAAKKPLFETYPAPGDENRADFKSVVQQLIEKGAELHDFLFKSVPKEMKKHLRTLKTSSDKTVQVIRHDPNNVFPWSIVYDFQLPTKIAGAPPPSICLGTGPASAAASADDNYPARKCSHGPDDEVYCIYGFWGLRHQVEQLVELPTEKKDAITDIVPSSKQSFVRLAVSTGDDHAKKLAESMAKEMGAGFVDTTSADDLVDLLWDDSKRPAVLVVMGHLQQSPITGEPAEPRIVLVPKQKWFTASSILKRLKKVDEEEWKQPNTLVLLMACSSGATEISTLNDFVTNLTSAGAAAVVGTECLVFSSLVARFAREVTSDLWNQKRLGEAVKFFNRRLVSAGNPLAFVFNYLGHADIRLIRPQQT